MAVVRVELAAAAEDLAHAGALEGQLDELVGGGAGGLGECHDDRPPADRGGTEERERLADRLDGARQREERRVDVAQQLEAEADIRADRVLELLERRVGSHDRGERAQGCDAAGADPAAPGEVGLGEEVALELREAELAGRGEIFRRRDLGGDELEVAAAQRVEVVVGDGRKRNLDRVADLKQRGLDAVDRQLVAAELEAPQRGQDLVGHRLGGDLQHDTVGPHRRRADLEQELGRDPHPRGVLAGEAIDPDVAEHVQQQRGGPTDPVAAGDELVAHDRALAVGDRPAHDRDLTLVRDDLGCVDDFRLGRGDDLGRRLLSDDHRRGRRRRGRRPTGSGAGAMTSWMSVSANSVGEPMPRRVAVAVKVRSPKLTVTTAGKDVSASARPAPVRVSESPRGGGGGGVRLAAAAEEELEERHPLRGIGRAVRRLESPLRAR